MVTKLSDGRGQITLKGHEITDDWERLVKEAAKSNGQTFAAFVAAITTEAAQHILKGESAVPAGVPARPEDVRDLLVEMREEVRAEMERLAQGQEALRERLPEPGGAQVAQSADWAQAIERLDRAARKARIAGRKGKR